MTTAWVWRPITAVSWRRASHAHAVTVESRYAVTLLFHLPRLGRWCLPRRWGFYTLDGWRPWETCARLNPAGPDAAGIIDGGGYHRYRQLSRWRQYIGRMD